MIYDFDQVIDRRASDSGKWGHYDEDVLPLWVADMDFVSPEPVIRALHERVEHGVFGYPIEDKALRQAVVERMAERYGWRIQPEDVLFVPGVVKGLNLACHALATPQGTVLVQPPVYPPILSAMQHTGMILQESQLVLDADGSYSIDQEAFKEAITDQTRLFILCNPHNPVGRVFRRDELFGMAEACLSRGAVICSDEIHSDLIYPGRQHIPIAALDGEIAQNTITLIAPTKTFNIAGLQCSFAIIQNPSLRNRFRHAHLGLAGWINVFGQTAALAAYRHGQEWLDQVLRYLGANRDYLFDYVRQKLPGIRMAKPEGTYLAWLDCREAGIPGEPYDFFLKQARVALNSGPTFGTGGEGFVRLNFACRRKILAQALDRMGKALRTVRR
jgi:cystathionine beta-lyase